MMTDEGTAVKVLNPKEIRGSRRLVRPVSGYKNYAFVLVANSCGIYVVCICWQPKKDVSQFNYTRRAKVDEIIFRITRKKRSMGAARVSSLELST